MTITRNFKLCLNAGTQNAPYINVNQYDEGEQWIFDLYTEGGQKFTPSTGAIIGIKSDGNAILNSGTVNSDGQVVITETQQMTAASGRAIYELLIDNATHGTANFIVNVERRPSDDAEFSDSDLSMLQEAIDSAAEIEDLLDGQDVPTVITPIISDWLDENITNPSNPPIDTSLTVAGAAADAKATGDKITDLNSAIEHTYNGEQYILTKFNSGFIGGTGAITGAGATTKEVYTDAITVSAGDVLHISLTWAESNSQWVAIATYNSSNTFLSRTALYSETGSSYSTTYTVASGVSYIRLTYRTYGSAVLELYKEWDKLIEIIDDEIDAKVPTISVSNSMLQNESVTPNKLSEEVASKTRNIFNYEWVHGQYGANGVYGDSAASDVRHAAVKPIIPVQGGETYTISWGTAEYTEGGTFYIEQFSSNDTMLHYDSIAFTDGKKTVTLEATTEKLGLMVYMWGTNAPASWSKCIPSWTQIEAGSSATSYVPPYQFNNSMIDSASLFSSDLFIEKVGNSIAYNKNSLTVKSIAHRGDGIDAPQCTAPSYILAKKHGYNIAENDLWLTEDGEFIMWHDTTLAILGNLVDINGYLMYTDGTDYYYVKPSDNSVYMWSGSDYVSSAVSLESLTRCAGANYGVNSQYASIGLNLDVLKRIDFGVYKGQQFKGTQILTFEEWVVLCKQLGMEIYVDKKLTYTTALLTNAANIVKKYGMDKYTSWLGVGNISDINLLRSICPNARVGILAHPNSTNIETYESVNTGRGFFFNGDAKNGMTEQAIQLGLNAGFDVEVWYVDYGNATEEQIFNTIRTAVSYGVTGITLDHYRVEDAFKYLLEQY